MQRRLLQILTRITLMFCFNSHFALYYYSEGQTYVYPNSLHLLSVLSEATKSGPKVILKTIQDSPKCSFDTEGLLYITVKNEFIALERAHGFPRFYSVKKLTSWVRVGKVHDRSYSLEDFKGLIRLNL